MDIIEAIKSRKSIRGYKTDPVPKNIIEEILEIASRAPSSMNTQPWEFTVVAGEALDKLRKANIEKLSAGETPGMDVHRGGYQGGVPGKAGGPGHTNIPVYGYRPRGPGETDGVDDEGLPAL